MRVDANVSITMNGFSYPRTEIKNINSIKLLHNSIENELQRQKKLIENGQEIVSVTLNLDENGEIIVTREKGDGLDYRFTPEPNLPRITIENDWVNTAKSRMSNTVGYMEYIDNYNIDPLRAIEIAVSF